MIRSFRHDVHITEAVNTGLRKEWSSPVNYVTLGNDYTIGGWAELRRKGSDLDTCRGGSASELIAICQI